MVRNTKELYVEIYKCLKLINDNQNEGIDYLKNLERQTRNSIVNTCIEYNLLIGFNFHLAASGNYTFDIRPNSSLSIHGLRFIYFYEKYHDTDLDIISLLSDTTGIVEKITSKEQFSNIKQLIVIIVTALITSYVTTLF